MNFLQDFNQKYEFYIRVYLKRGTKSEDWKYLGAKSWRNFLERLKRKVDIFVGPKIYLTLNI